MRLCLTFGGTTCRSFGGAAGGSLVFSPIEIPEGSNDIAKIMPIMV